MSTGESGEGGMGGRGSRPKRLEAFQELIPGNMCFGCGPDNPHGLRIKSRWEGDEALCRFQPSAHHCAGPPDVLNGGIIGTLIDCHSVCTAIADAYRAEGRAIGSGPPIWFVTAALRITYLAPTGIDHPVDLWARIHDRAKKKTIVRTRLLSAGMECARGEVVAVRVSGEWTHGRR
jgi:acyl-coenzyme A thioesterase PaaI-like protein